MYRKNKSGLIRFVLRNNSYAFYCLLCFANQTKDFASCRPISDGKGTRDLLLKRNAGLFSGTAVLASGGLATTTLEETVERSSPPPLYAAGWALHHREGRRLRLRHLDSAGPGIHTSIPHRSGSTGVCDVVLTARRETLGLNFFEQVSFTGIPVAHPRQCSAAGRWNTVIGKSPQ